MCVCERACEKNSCILNIKTDFVSNDWNNLCSFFCWICVFHTNLSFIYCYKMSETIDLTQCNLWFYFVRHEERSVVFPLRFSFLFHSWWQHIRIWTLFILQQNNDFWNLFVFVHMFPLSSFSFPIIRFSSSFTFFLRIYHSHETKVQKWQNKNYRRKISTVSFRM